MNSIHCKKFNILQILAMVAGVLLASAFLFSFVVQAQTDADHEAEVQAAIEDLSSATGQDITSEDQAEDLCNQEQYWEVCADVGKKHDLYTEEEVKHVDEFLGEIKGKVLDDIKNCQDEECLIRVANELANKIQVKNPTLATNFKLTSTLIEEKNAVVQAAKEAGVDFRDCEAMDPDTAPIELLRQCAKLAKDTRIQKYIPEERRVLAEQFEDSATLKLREALSAGRYQCGDNTLEGCGNYCLNPTGTTGIPPVCAQIASEIFGEEGVKQLEAAQQHVGKVKDYYSKKFILTLPSGKELIGERQIKSACDEAFSGRLNNLEMAKACGAFAVQNGFATQTDVDRGLKLMESFSNKGQNVNFDDCLANPTACRDFIPEDERDRFDAGNQIFEIMKTEIGFDPSQCERGSVDQAIGTKCFEGSRRALTKIESLGLATQSREAGFIIEDIRRHVSEGEDHMNRKDEFRQVFDQQGGPGGCKSEAECFTYCSNPTNGPECIAFGSKQGISGFRGQEAVQRFQDYNQNIQRPGFASDEGYRPYSTSGDHGPYFPPGGDVIYPPGQDPRFTQPGPGYNNPPPGTGSYYPLYPGGQGPAGPSPECFAAIQSGDFVKAKAVCEVHTPNQPFPSGPVCPASLYVQCPAGEYRESYRNNDGCWIDGPCKPAPSYSAYPTYTPYQGDPNSCPSFSYSRWFNGKRYCQLNETRACQSDYPAYLERGNYSPSNCPAEENYPGSTPPPSCPSGQWWDYTRNMCGSGTTSYTPYPSCPEGQWWNYTYNKCTPVCVTSSYWDEATKTCKPSGGTYSPYPTSTGGIGDMYNCFYPNATVNGKYPGYTVWCEKDYFNCHEGTKTGPSIGLTGLSLGAPSSCESGYQGQSCNNNGFCDSNETTTSCPSDCKGSTYTPYPTYSSGPGGSTCSQSLINLLGTGCHWMYSDSAGRGIYCDGPMTKSAKEGDSATTAGCTGGGETYTPYPSYTPPGTGSCPAGYHYHGESGGFCMNDQENYGAKCYNASGTSTITCPAQASYTPAPSCPSGQWWDSATSSCKSSTTSCTGTTQSSCTSVSNCYWNSSSNYCYYQSTPPGTSYTPYPSYSYAPTPSCPSGQLWDSITNSCRTNTTTCSSGYYLENPNDTSCKPIGSTSPISCPSGQWWDSATNSCKYSTTPNCGNHVCDSGETSTSCYSDCGGGTSYTPYPTPDQSVTCSSSGGTWNGSTCTYPTTSYTPPPYTPPPSCSSGQYWDGSACVANPTPYPTTTYSPPPTSSLYPSYMVAHCQQLGRTWNGEICRANGLFARIYESYTNDFATILKAFGF